MWLPAAGKEVDAATFDTATRDGEGTLQDGATGDGEGTMVDDATGDGEDTMLDDATRNGEETMLDAMGVRRCAVSGFFPFSVRVESDWLSLAFEDVESPIQFPCLSKNFSRLRWMGKGFRRSPGTSL